MKISAAILSLALLATSASSHAFRLIHEDEARLPAAPGGLATRGITRGPGVKLVSPDPAAGLAKSPINLKVVFEPRGGAKIDPASIKVFYLKATPIDLLERVRPGLTATGIDLAGAEVPPGEHPIQVTVQDSEGRKTTAVINLSVAK